jgi:uncharacterized membrane protein
MFAGTMHIIKPKIFKNFTPPFLPVKITNYLAGIVEFSLGLGLLFSQTAQLASAGIFILMILFLPIHIWDVTKVRPAIGTKLIAVIRIPIQFLLMYLAYLIYINS